MYIYIYVLCLTSKSWILKCPTGYEFVYSGKT